MADQRSTERETDFRKPGRVARNGTKGKKSREQGETGPKDHYTRQRFNTKDVYDILDAEEFE
jgi:hypothetical protein